MESFHAIFQIVIYWKQQLQQEGSNNSQRGFHVYLRFLNIYYRFESLNQKNYISLYLDSFCIF